MPDFDKIIRDARKALADEYSKASLARHAAPLLSDDQKQQLISEALWSRSLSISAAGRYHERSAPPVIFSGVDDEPEGQAEPTAEAPKVVHIEPTKPKKSRRVRGVARAEGTALAARIVAKWLNHVCGLGVVGKAKRLGDYEAIEFVAMAMKKRELASEYGQQADSDDMIAAAMKDNEAATADELPADVLYELVKSYRLIPNPEAVEATDDEDGE